MTIQRSVTVGDIRIGDRERQYVNEVLDSGRLSYGPFSRRFEAGWAAQHECEFAVFCNSGTSALHIALAALKKRHGWSDGDEVLVPAVTFVATANVCLHNNLKPVFVDVSPDTYNIDPQLIEAKITDRTRCIIPVHLCGLPAYMPTIMKIAKFHNLKVVEDSCETTFASIGGKRVGSWGDVGCFSTYMAHYIVTGVGGLATTNNPELAVDLRSLMNHGRDSIYLSIDDDDNATGERKKEIIARRFQFVHVGHSFRCTELEAALGLAQLERSQEIVAARRRVAAGYTKGLRELRNFIQLPCGLEHVYMLYPIVMQGGRSKVEMVNFLEENGIETRDLLPLINQPVYREMFGNLDAEYPVAARLNRDAFYIGCHQYITPEDVAHVVRTIHTFFGIQQDA